MAPAPMVDSGVTAELGDDVRCDERYVQAPIAAPPSGEASPRPGMVCCRRGEVLGKYGLQALGEGHAAPDEVEPLTVVIAAKQDSGGPVPAPGDSSDKGFMGVSPPYLDPCPLPGVVALRTPFGDYTLDTGGAPGRVQPRRRDVEIGCCRAERERGGEHFVGK